MITIYYGVVFAVSLVCSAIYIYMWHKHFDVNFTMIFTLVPIANLGFFLYSSSVTLEEAALAQKIAYIGGCYLQLFIFLSIFNLCRIDLPRWFRAALFIIITLLYSSVLTIGYNKIFYKEMSFKVSGGNAMLSRSYGFMHNVFYASIAVFFITSICAIIYSWMKKKQVPRTIIYLLVLPDVICMLSYFLGRKIIPNLDVVPVGYVLAQIIFLIIAYRVNLYDVSETAIDSMVQDKDIGYVSCDFKLKYLGSNETARMLCPELNDKAVDEVLGYKPSERRIRHYLDSFTRDESNNTFVYTVHGNPENGENNGDGENSETGEDDERIYNVTVGYLYEGGRKRGYIITFNDDTANRKYIRLLDNYNESLQEEVEQKTKHIIEMHDNLIMSLAMMVESRDNSTGGHIKRTSTGVRILVDEILKEGKLSLTEEFCEDVIKAAPMHDLGKIAVDDAVLRKPGRFTDEEYAKMKKHAAEGARVIHEILLNTDDESFKTVAENVAHYHHERWDGSGYPEGLSGNAIPIEARIMAIADVYDALVSKRVYKEAFDFNKANNIILEGMGTQFDPGLRSAYENARPRLEEYYSA